SRELDAPRGARGGPAHAGRGRRERDPPPLRRARDDDEPARERALPPAPQSRAGSPRARRPLAPPRRRRGMPPLRRARPRDGEGRDGGAHVARSADPARRHGRAVHGVGESRSATVPGPRLPRRPPAAGTPPRLRGGHPLLPRRLARAPGGADRPRRRAREAPRPLARAAGAALATDDLPPRAGVAAAHLGDRMKAAVMRAVGAPLAIEEIEIDGPRPGEVLVRTVATGVCHSDRHSLDGSPPRPPPTVLGHEPAGVVEAVGADVRHVAPGDHVIGCLSAFCGACEYCIAGRPYLCEGEAIMRRADEPPRLAKDGEPIAQFVHLSAFAERMLVHENALVRIRRDVPLDRVALIGCGVTTGLGAVFNRARLRAGETAAVIGCGGIGLAVVQGCRIAGAGRIVAVDTIAWKLELASRLGATDVVHVADGNPVARVVELTAGGGDYALEARGAPAAGRPAGGLGPGGGAGAPAMAAARRGRR